MLSRSRSTGCFPPRLVGSLVLMLLISFHARAERLPIRTYTNADGLWSSSISYLMRDSHGFIWFCTRDGLSRFDGYRFINYRVGDAATPPHVSYIVETRAGLYYIVVNGGGLYRFDPNAANAPDATQDRAPGDNRRPTLNALKVSERSPGLIYEDRAGRLWATVDGLSLAEDTGQSISFRQVDLGLPDRDFAVAAICEGRDGSLWLGTSRGLIRRLPDGRVVQFAVHPGPSYDTVRILMEDHAGHIWIGHGDGLYVLQPEPLAHLATAGRYTKRALNARPPVRGEPLLPDVPNEAVDFTIVGLHGTPARRSMALTQGLVAGLIQPADGRVWIATPDGLTVFDGRRFHSYAPEHGLTHSTIGYFVEDGGGDLWLASLTGAIRLRVQGLTTYGRADGLGDPQVHSIYEDRSGTLHVVSGNWLINRLGDDGKFASIHANVPLTAKFWWTSNVAFLDRAGEWWMLTAGRLYRFSHARQVEDLARQPPTAVYEDGNGVHSKQFYCMFEDSRGDLWISMRGAGEELGMTKWERSTQTFQDMNGVEGFPAHKSPSSFAEDRAGNLWFGLYEGGLLRYAGGRFEAFKPDDGLPAGLISGLHLDRAGRLWIASSTGGVGRVDDPTAARPRFASYTEKEGLSSNNARCLTEDLQGRIYIGTVRGVDRLDPETGSVTHFAVTDGLAADFVRTAFRDRHGTLWFGTFNGLSRLDPRPEQRRPVPAVLITGLRVAGVRQHLSELGTTRVAGLQLAASQNNLEIDFSSLGIAHPASLRYQYKLEGADLSWSSPAEQRRVNYANLAPGKYLFVVRTVSVDGVANEQSATVGFVILPPFWQRWWFLSAAAALFAASLYALYRYRVNQLLQVERVRMRIATDLHDDIGASLSRIAILSEVVKHQAGAISEQPTTLLTEIAESARGLVDSMGDIVWSIDPRRDDLSSVVQRVRQFASDVLEARGIAWEFRAPPAAERLKVDPEQRRHLFLIFKEGINNVVRHAGGCRSVALSISVGDNQLLGEIADDGCGFVQRTPPARANGRGGNGLLNMRARAEQLGGRLDIESGPGLGTRLKLRVPLK